MNIFLKERSGTYFVSGADPLPHYGWKGRHSTFRPNQAVVRTNQHGVQSVTVAGRELSPSGVMTAQRRAVTFGDFWGPPLSEAPEWVQKLCEEQR